MPKKQTHQEILGSEAESNACLVVLFIPSKTDKGKDLPHGEDQKMWADAAGSMLADQFGGCTEMPVAKGMWRNDDGDIVCDPSLASKFDGIARRIGLGFSPSGIPLGRSEHPQGRPTPQAGAVVQDAEVYKGLSSDRRPDRRNTRAERRPPALREEQASVRAGPPEQRGTASNCTATPRRSGRLPRSSGLRTPAASGCRFRGHPATDAQFSSHREKASGRAGARSLTFPARPPELTRNDPDMTSYPRISPPLKWHGGKWYLARRIVAKMPPHIHYVEPFAGGLSVLLAKDPEGVSEVVNDINGDLAVQLLARITAGRFVPPLSSHKAVPAGMAV